MQNRTSPWEVLSEGGVLATLVKDRPGDVSSAVNDRPDFGVQWPTNNYTEMKTFDKKPYLSHRFSCKYCPRLVWQDPFQR